MLGVREVTQVTRAFGEKTVGIGLELVGTFAGNERLRDSGRQLEESANERLRAVEEETKSAARQAKARAAETKQRVRQSRSKRSTDKAPVRTPQRDAASRSPRRAL